MEVCVSVADIAHTFLPAEYLADAAAVVPLHSYM